MSTTETDQRVPAEADVCSQCGATLAGGRFCSECGQPVTAIEAWHVPSGPAAHADAPTIEAPGAARAPRGGVTATNHAVSAAPGARSRGRRTGLIAGFVAATAVIAAV